MAGIPPTELPSQPDLKSLVISATFTSEPIRATLDFWLAELGLEYNVEFAPYNQVFQTLLDPASLIARNTGVNVLLIRLADWGGPDPNAAEFAEQIENNVSALISILKTASLRAPLLVFLCPSSPQFDSLHPDLAARTEERIRLQTADLGGVHLVGPQTLATLYPVDPYYDETANQLGHVPYTPEMFAALGTLVARRILALRTIPYKVIALDCDNTLWRGICGEDGPENVVIDEPRRALQQFMREQRDAGMLLVMCSRNNEPDVLEVFRAHPEMPLRIEDFVTWRINWEPKSANLASIADELELGLDSLIFIDDDLKECGEVEANCPEVLTLGLTQMGADFAHFLHHVWAFDHWKVTDEDRRRSAMYAEQAERAKAEKSAVNLEDFIAGLNLQLTIQPVTPEQMPRVAQLTQRTNQMNLTTVRRSEPEIDELLRSGALECLTVDVSDRFGSYGLVGIVLFGIAGQSLRIDTFLLSCRALGRGVEHRILSRVGEIASERGLQTVEAPFVPTARNQPALAFLRSIPPGRAAENGAGVLFRFAAADLIGLEYHPGERSGADTAAAKSTAAKKKRARTFSDFGHIAEHLSTTGDILAEVRTRIPAAVNGAGALPSGAAVVQGTELEQRVAAIWSELLHVPHVGLHDNFFDLGGHSLLAVQLLSRLRQEFNVDLSLEVVYTGTLTVAELAKAIELYELGQIDPAQYAELLAELDGLSDEEIAALLAQEEEAGEASRST